MRQVKKLLEPRVRVRFLSDDVEEDRKINPGERSRLMWQCEAAKSEHLLTIIFLTLSIGMRLNGIRYLA